VLKAAGQRQQVTGVAVAGLLLNLVALRTRRA
jgi:hypothetical protein